MAENTTSSEQNKTISATASPLKRKLDNQESGDKVEVENKKAKIEENDKSKRKSSPDRKERRKEKKAKKSKDEKEKKKKSKEAIKKEVDDSFYEEEIGMITFKYFWSSQ